MNLCSTASGDSRQMCLRQNVPYVFPWVLLVWVILGIHNPRAQCCSCMAVSLTA